MDGEKRSVPNLSGTSSVSGDSNSPFPPLERSGDSGDTPMTPERHRLIGQLYIQAIELASGDREPFLENACGDDFRLRAEVESLIVAHENAADFIATPPSKVAAEMIADTRTRTMVGRVFGHYRIVELMAAGGMGEVYRAVDTRLGRSVAIKVLPAHLAANPDALRRFEREARTVAALSHPNILSIHDFGNEGGIRYAVMELLEGETLKARLRRSVLDWREAVTMAAAIADGLAAAHAKGVIHRDLKPANIFLTTFGQVKILDFGIARVKPDLIGPQGLNPAFAETTNPGTVIGTVGYMSPEQARGEVAEAPSDIFTLGCLISESLTAKRPFARGSAAETLAAIIKDEPPDPPPQIPERLKVILRTCLDKNHEKRYQTARQLATELREVLRDSVGATEPLSGSRIGARLTKTTRSQELFREITQRMRSPVLIATAVIVGVVMGGVAWWAYLNRHEGQPPFDNARVERIATNGNAASAAISRDGKYIAYSLREADKHSLWVRQAATSGTIRLVPPTDSEFDGVTFSPDSNYIYYNASTTANELNVSSALYRLPTLGGSPAKLLENIRSQVKFSPDGKRMAFLRSIETGRRETHLIVANRDGTDLKVLNVRKAPDHFEELAWSPDGRTIACAIITTDEKSFYATIIGIDVDDKVERPLVVSSTEGGHRWQEIADLIWLPGGKGLIVAAKDENASFTQLWEISHQGGQARRITNDLSDYLSVSLTEDTQALVTVQRQRLANVWQIESNRDEVPVTHGAGRYFDLSWTPDGKILYASDSSGSADIWEMDQDATGQRQLTSGSGRNYGPAASPDGKYVVFHSNRSGAWNIWRMDRDGGNLKQLTNAPGFSNFPYVSPDSKWVIYHHNESETPITIWKVPIDGGTPLQITADAAVRPSVSPDGQQIACWYSDLKPNSTPRIAIIPMSGGQPTKLLPVPPSAKLSGIIGALWLADGKSLSYVDSRGGVDNLWRLPLDGSAPTPITNFKTDMIESYTWSRDGKLACSRGVITQDVMILRESK